MKTKGASNDFPVVCVGGSAGGLDAYIRLLRNLPADLGVAIVIVNHPVSYTHLGVSVSSNLFSTTFFTLTGFHGLHVCVGLIALLIVLGLTLAGDFKRSPSPALKAVGLYWHFVDLVWVVVFSTIYLLPHFR